MAKPNYSYEKRKKEIEKKKKKEEKKRRRLDKPGDDGRFYYEDGTPVPDDVLAAEGDAPPAGENV